MKKHENTRIVRRLIWSILPMHALASGLPAVNDLLNSFIIGNAFGTTALASIGFFAPLSMCMEAISGVLAMGMQLVCGNLLGKGDRDGLNSAFTGTAVMCLLFGALFTAVLELFPKELASLLGATGVDGLFVADYIRGRGIGRIFAIFSACGTMLLQLERKKLVCTISVVARVITNVGGNLLNAYCLHWGIFGVGFFVSLSSAVSAAIAFGYILFKSRLFHFSPKLLRRDVMLDILKRGSPDAVSNLCSALRGRVVNYFVFMLGGNIGMAAMSIAGTINGATGDLIAAGYLGAGRTVSSVLAGQRDNASLRDLPKVMAGVVAPLYIAAYVVVFIFAKPIALLLGANAASIGMYVVIVRIYNLYFFSNIFRMPPNCIYQAMGNTKLIMLSNICKYGVFPIGICFAFGKIAGITIIASIPLLTDILICVMFAVIFACKAHRLPRSPLELCYVPSSLSASHDNRYKATIGTIDDALTASEEAMQFCRTKGISPKRAYICALCIEEMAVDAIRNRFTDKNATIDLRMIYEDGHITLLMRDDCKRFDPVEWLKLCKPEDEVRSIGIRMVSKVAQDINYINTLGMNVLTIRI